MACSTGIESTKTIKMNKQDVKLLTKSEEQLYAAALQGTPLADWKVGKKFFVMTPRSLYIFDPSSFGDVSPESLEGKTLEYVGTEKSINPDLVEETIMLFTDGQHTFKYNTGRSLSEAETNIISSKMPLLSDVDLTELWSGKLKGKTLWTRSNLWYNEDGLRSDGLKFVEVTVVDVSPSTGDFPMKVKINYRGKTSYMYMNYTSDTADSRNFAALFYFNDPKLKYPQISEENWKLIQSGRVGHGMTKDECRLALGTPDELHAGHSTSQTMDVWQYSNGTYLFFTDGLLTSFRQ